MYERQNSMQFFIAFRFSRITEATMKVKCAIGKAILHKLPLYNEYMCLCWVYTLFCMICCLFSNCSKSSTTLLRSLYNFLMCHVHMCPYSLQYNSGRSYLGHHYNILSCRSVATTYSIWLKATPRSREEIFKEIHKFYTF